MELIGKYAMRDLVQKLPSGNPQRDHGTSDDTIAAVLATLNEVIKKHPEFSRSLLEAGGVDRLMTITHHRQRFTPRVVKFASQVLYSTLNRPMASQSGTRYEDRTMQRGGGGSGASHG